MYAQLRLNTEYTPHLGICRIDPLMKKLKALGMDACAITDRGVLYGALEFYRAAKSEGIHPVIGCEMEIAADREPADGALLLLCENRQGYRSLCALLTVLEGERLPVESDLLAKYREDLIAIAVRPARSWASECRDIFGPERFFIGLDGDAGAGEIELAREWNVPTVYTGACRYLEPEDAEAYWALVCCEAGKTLADRASAMRAQYHLRSEAEIIAANPELRDALTRSDMSSRSAATWNLTPSRRTCRASRCPRA